MICNEVSPPCFRVALAQALVNEAISNEVGGDFAIIVIELSSKLQDHFLAQRFDISAIPLACRLASQFCPSNSLTSKEYSGWLPPAGMSGCPAGSRQ